MTQPIDLAQLMTFLESPELSTAREIRDLITENLKQGKESWLVNGLVDFYVQTHSERAQEILSSVTEPHDKQLLDKLVDHLKGSGKLQALMLLGHLVRGQSPWIHKLVHHSVMSQVLKIIKTEVDVPILMSAVLFITCLLPFIPDSVAQYLQEIFDGFARLAAFNLKKPGTVPDIYLVHLQVGIYSLFHRLYGMYPCHFLTYLRAVYSKKENAQVFKETIMPMLERVRMHPLLVTATKDKEISRERWVKQEAHDVIVDCAKLSLDMIEGSKEESRCPVITSHCRASNNNSQTLLSNSWGGGGQLGSSLGSSLGASNTAMGFKQMLRDLPTPDVIGVDPDSGQKPIVSSVDPYSFFSPSTVVGLTTPPPSSAQMTPVSADQSGSVTPRHTPHSSESPHPGESTDKGSASHPTVQKRLSGLSMSLSGIPPYTSSSGGSSGSVPPSPLKPDFTSEPPFSAYRMHAVRKIDFQQGQFVRSPPLKTEQPSPSKGDPSKKADSKPVWQKSEESLQKERARATFMRQPTLDQSSPTAMVQEKEAARHDGKDVTLTAKDDGKDLTPTTNHDGKDVILTAKHDGKDFKSSAKHDGKDLTTAAKHDGKDVIKGFSTENDQSDQQQRKDEAVIQSKDDRKGAVVKKQRSRDSLYSRQKSDDKAKEGPGDTTSDVQEELGDDGKTVGKKSSTVEQKAALLSKFETTKADPKAKLTRKASGKRQRSTESRPQESSVDGVAMVTSDEAGVGAAGGGAGGGLSKEAGVPLRIPGHSRFDQHLVEGGHAHSVPSVSELPNFIESLGVSQEDADDEVSALTGSYLDDSSMSSSCTDPCDASLTAESVQRFMKNVNRIRFNSMNVNSREKIETLERNPKILRPSSCPDFEKEDAEDFMQEETEEQVNGLSSRKTPGEETTAQGMKAKWTANLEAPVEVVSTHTVTSTVTTVTSSKTTIASQTSFANLGELDPGEIDVSMGTDEEMQTVIPYMHMFPMALPFAPFMRCYNCVRAQGEGQKEDGAKSHGLEIVGEIPFFSTLSPPELLDRHIQLGNETHAKELSHMALTSKEPVNWTYFGGVPPADEVSILRGQVLLLHNQLMYERHKREMYARRNRRLLGRIVKTTALEEQTNAMKDQLVLQETELHSLTQMLKKCRAEKHDLQQVCDKLEYTQNTARRNAQEEIDKLKRKHTELLQEYQNQKADNLKIHRELQAAMSELFNKEQELESVKLRADFAQDLQGQLSRLNKELLLMGELQQKYRQRLSSVSCNQNSRAETNFQLDAYKVELNETKQSLEVKTVLYDASKAKLTDVEEMLKTKEGSITELKRMVENMKEMHIGQIQALDAKYKNERRIQQALQGQILDLTARLHSQNKPQRPLMSRPEDGPLDNSRTQGSARQDSVEQAEEVATSSQSSGTQLTQAD